MSMINYASREINCKLVYYGPGLGGKTTNLEHIYGKVSPNTRGKMISLATETERTLFFDRSEEHTSELQSLRHLVCRLLLEKKKKGNDEDIPDHRCARCITTDDDWN